MSDENTPDEFLAKLKEAFKDYQAEIPIVTHDFPDPDAIASAMGMSEVLKLLGLKPGGIYYTGEISHPQNKSLVNLLNIFLINYEKEPFEKGLPCICVDINDVGEGTNQPRITSELANVKAVIDHHKGKNPSDALVDSRHSGSTSAIVWEYLKKLNFNFNNEHGEAVATSLIVGVKTDTMDLLSDNTSKLDSDAHEDLRHLVDKQTLISLINYPLPEYFFELRQVANLEENKNFENSTLVAGVGIITPAKRDALPIIADEFLRMPSVQTSVIFAVIGDCVDISVRSINISVDVGNFLKTVFGNGGGKRGAGRAKIPLGFFHMDGLDTDLQKDVWNVVKSIVLSRVMQNVKGER